LTDYLDTAKVREI